MHDAPALLTPLQARAVRARCGFTAVRTAMRVVTRLFDESFRPLGVTTSQFESCMVVRGHGPITIGGIAEHMSASPATTSRNIRKLQKLGLVRLDAGEDRRRREVHLTPAGEDLVRRGVPVWRDTQNQLEAHMGAEFRELHGHLRRLAELEGE